MLTTDEIKEENVPVTSYDHQLCTACLCATRTTHTLDDDLLKFYVDILIETQWTRDVSTSPSVCWECLSVLRTWSRFREQVKGSFVALQSALLRCDQQDINEFLVKEVSRPGRLMTVFIYAVDISPRQTDDDAAAGACSLGDEGTKLNDEHDQGTKLDDEHTRLDNEGTKLDDEHTKLDDEHTKHDEENTKLHDEGTKLDDKGTKLDDEGTKHDDEGTKLDDEVTAADVCSRDDDDTKLDDDDELLATLKEEAECEIDNAKDDDIVHNNVDPLSTIEDEYVESNSKIQTDSLAVTQCTVVLCSNDQCTECLKGSTSIRTVVVKTPKGEVNEESISDKLGFDKSEIRDGTRTQCTSPVLPPNRIYPLQKVAKLEKQARNRHNATSSHDIQCKVCLKKIARLNINSHMRYTHHLRDTPPDPPCGVRYECDVCHKRYKTKLSLRHHIQCKHTGISPNFMCDVCHKKYVTMIQLRRHKYDVHTDGKGGECDVCHKRYKTKLNLQHHIQCKHTGLSPNFMCDVCQKKYVTMIQLRRHKYLAHAGDKPVYCDTCHKEFPSKGTLLTHIIWAHKERSFLCEVCSKAFISGSALRRHLNSHTTERLFQCKHCLVRLRSKEYLRTHQKQHKCRLCNEIISCRGIKTSHMLRHPDRGRTLKSPKTKTGTITQEPFQCEHCPAKFINRDVFERHHQQQNCQVCNQTFSCKSRMVDHARSHRRKKVNCPVCDKLMACKLSLRTHMRLHTCETFDCEVCSKQYNNRSVLLKHKQRKHTTGTRPFQCEICPKAYFESKELTDHMLTHTGTKLHQCSVCLKKFMTKGYLRIHLITHSDAKPFQCDICQNSFKRKQSMEKHILKHSGIKPFKCEVCSNSFYTRPHLKRHKIVHTRERAFKCTICLNAYTRKDYLLAHMRCVHPSAPP